MAPESSGRGLSTAGLTPFNITTVTRRNTLLDSPAAPSPRAIARGAALSRAPLILALTSQLGASPEIVFSFISHFERLPEWMPLMKRVHVDNRNAVSPGGVGAVRIIDSGFGKPTEETVVAFEPPCLLAYSASDASLRGMFRNHLGLLHCEPREAGGTLLSWLSYATPGKGPQRLLGPTVFKQVIQRSLTQLARSFPV